MAMDMNEAINMENCSCMLSFFKVYTIVAPLTIVFFMVNL